MSLIFKRDLMGVGFSPLEAQIISAGSGREVGVVDGLEEGTNASIASMNTSAIQSALNECGTVFITCPPDETSVTYYISSSLVIYSNTLLILGAGVRLKMAAGVQKKMLATAAHVARSTTYSVTSFTSSGLIGTVTRTAHGRSVGDWVSLTGSTSTGYVGTFQINTVPTADTYTVTLEKLPSTTTAAGTIVERTATHDIAITGDGIWDGNRANRTLKGSHEDFGICLEFCGNVYLDVKGENVLHRFVAPSVVNGLKGRVQTFNARGGFISFGAMANVDVEVRCTYTTDDISGIQASDYTQFNPSPGDIVKTKISIFGDTDFNACKIVGASGFVVELDIDEIEAESGEDLIQAVNDTSVVSFGTSVERLRIGSLRHLKPVNNKAGVCVATASGACTIRNLVLGAVKIDVPSGVTYKLIYPNNANSTITHTQLSNIDVKGAAANQDIKICHQVGNMTRVQMNNVRLENGGNLYDHDSAGSLESGQVVELNNVVQISCTAGIGFRRNITVHANNWQMSSTGNGAFSSGSAATLTFVGNLISDKHANLAGSARVTPYSQTWQADGDFVTGAIKSMFWNTNTTWASGSGVDKSGMYGYTGAAWTKIFGPA